MARDRIALCFFVDALGWEAAQRHRSFEAVAPHAYRQRTILGYSCAAQPTILTGAMPVEHGHWAMFERSDRSSLAPLRALRFLPPAVADHRRLRRQVLTLHRRATGLTGYYNFYRVPFRLFGLFDICEKRDIYAPGAFRNGVESIFDILARENVPYRRWTWTTALDRSFEELGRALRSDDEIRFALVYTAHLDALLHDEIGNDAAVAGELARLEGLIAGAVELAHSRYDRVDVLVFSDHGMIETTRTFDLMRYVSEMEAGEPHDYIAFYDSTMGRFWFSDDRTRRKVEEGLDSLDCGTILTEDDLEREGIRFEDGRFGELIYLMNPGVLVLPSYMGATAPAGMHGFTPEHEDSYAILRSSGSIEPAPAHIRDTFRVMRDLVTQGSAQ
jgi:hypothetical protein